MRRSVPSATHHNRHDRFVKEADFPTRLGLRPEFGLGEAGEGDIAELLSVTGGTG